jgi:DNA-binding LacI/PurR family transcriptional regulator
MAISCKEIAAQLGISKQAVYSVLGNKPVCHVSPDKHEKILNLAKAHHYQPSRAALRLKGQSCRTIGVISDGFRGPGGIHLEILSTLLHLENYTPYTVYFSGIAQACEAIARFTADGVDAVIYPHYVLEKLRCEDVTVPAVISGLEVMSDYAGGTRSATEHLIRAHGHRKILFIAVELLYAAADKYRGYRSAMEKAGLAPLSALQSLNNKEFESQLAAQLKAGATAIVTPSDSIAAELIHYLRLCGIRVPEDVAVTGFDHLGDHPEITSVVDPAREYASAIRDVLFEKIRGGILHAIEPRLIPMPLYCSSSCGCPGGRTANFTYQYSLITGGAAK